MKKLGKKVFAFLFVSCLAVTAVFAQARVGEVAPPFSVTTDKGQTITNASFKKTAVLLHFWGTWCPPCRAELPEMNKLAEKLAASKDSALAFVGVAVSDTPVAVSTFMTKNGYTFTNGLDATNEISKAYQIQAVPTTILISPDGTVEKIQMGAMTKAQLENFVSKYMTAKK